MTIPLLGRDMCVEVKVRAHGFSQLYSWLNDREILIVKQDRREPLVILPLRLAAEIAGPAEPVLDNILYRSEFAHDSIN